MNFFDRNKREVTEFLDAYLGERKPEFDRVNRWGGDTLDKILPFSKTGKMLRSGLVTLGYLLAGGKRPAAVRPAAAAVELIQSALLIHDDIIDRDTLRRGLPAVHFQYERQGEASNVEESGHFGAGMGICAGDIGFFLAFELLSGMRGPAGSKKERVLHLWARELSYVGLAQMQDLYFGTAEAPVTEEAILALYRYKTARYSFTVPLVTGCILGGGGTSLQEKLDVCGESMGILFQLRDDELGLYGSEAELGKPVGSDIRENKKTLYHHHLFLAANADDRRRLLGMFGNEELNQDMIDEVRVLLDEYGVTRKVKHIMRDLQDRAARQIQDLDAGAHHKRVLSDLLDYIMTRKQ